MVKIEMSYQTSYVSCIQFFFVQCILKKNMCNALFVLFLNCAFLCQRRNSVAGVSILTVTRYQSYKVRIVPMDDISSS